MKDKRYNEFDTDALSLDTGRMRLAYLTSFREIVGDEHCGQSISDYGIEYFPGTLERMAPKLNNCGQIAQSYELVLVMHDDAPGQMRRIGNNLPWRENLEISGRRVVEITENIPSHYRTIHPDSVDLIRQQKEKEKLIWERQVNKILFEYNVDVVWTDSWLPIFTRTTLFDWEGLIINSHPAITRSSNPRRLPGLYPTSDALDRFRNINWESIGRRSVYWPYTGATLHYTNAQIDSGNVINDLESTHIYEDDTTDSLRIRNYKTKQTVVEQGLLLLAQDDLFQANVRKIRQIRDYHRKENGRRMS